MANRVTELEERIITQVACGACSTRAAIHCLFALEPQNITANFQMCLLELAAGRPRIALIFAKEVLRLSPSEPNAWLNLGVAYHRTNRYTPGIQCYRME